MPSPLLPYLHGAGLLSLGLLLYLLWWWDAPAPWKSRLCPYQHPYALCAVCSGHCVPPPLRAPQPRGPECVHYRDCTGCGDCPNGDKVENNDVEVSAVVVGSILVALFAMTAIAPLGGLSVAIVLGFAVAVVGRDVKVVMPKEDCPCMPDVGPCPYENGCGAEYTTQ